MTSYPLHLRLGRGDSCREGPCRHHIHIRAAERAAAARPTYLCAGRSPAPPERRTAIVMGIWLTLSLSARFWHRGTYRTTEWISVNG